jgi:hypothetical protein
VVIGLNPGGLTGQDHLYTLDYAASLGLTFPIYLDQQGSYQGYVSTPSIAPFPLDVVIDREGTVTMVKRDYNIGALEAAVDAALAK